MNEKYGIKVIDYGYLLSNIRYKPHYIGIGDKNNSKLPKFLNWYDNIDYINKWDTKEEAEVFLQALMLKARENFDTKNDPFFNIKKTKGDWIYYSFVVDKIII